MLASLVFQSGLQYLELREAFLKNSKAVVLDKDLGTILWVSPRLASVLGRNIFELIGSDASFLRAILGNFLQKPMQNFGDEYEEAVLFYEKASSNLDFSHYLPFMEARNFASAIIYKDGTIRSQLGYKHKKLYRKISNCFSIEHIEIIAEIFLAIKKLLPKYIISPYKLIYKTLNLYKREICFSVFSFGKFFLVIIEVSDLPQITEDEAAFKKIAEILQANKA